MRSANFGFCSIVCADGLRRRRRRRFGTRRVWHPHANSDADAGARPCASKLRRAAHERADPPESQATAVPFSLEPVWIRCPTTSATAPSGLPVLQLRRLTPSSITPFFYITLTATAAVTSKSPPSLTVTLPAETPVQPYYLTLYRSAYWTTIAGPVGAAGSTVTFSGGTGGFNIATGQSVQMRLHRRRPRYADANAVSHGEARNNCNDRLVVRER
jgi:hypothetical protein